MVKLKSGKHKGETPTRLRTAYLFILSLRTAYGLILAFKTYRNYPMISDAKNNYFCVK